MNKHSMHGTFGTGSVGFGWVVACTFAAMWGFSSPAYGQEVCELPANEFLDGGDIGLEPVVKTKLATAITTAPGDQKHLYVATQVGEVWRLNPDEEQLPDTPFLDLTGELEGLVMADFFDERGLVGLAFDPADSETFYISISERRDPEPREPCGFVDIDWDWNDPKHVPGCHTQVLARCAVVDGDGDCTDREVVLAVDQPFYNHNGGSPLVREDGTLYWAVADGGDGGVEEIDGHELDLVGDYFNHAQNPSTLLGSVLRIDVTAQPRFVERRSPASGSASLPRRRRRRRGSATSRRRNEVSGVETGAARGVSINLGCAMSGGGPGYTIPADNPYFDSGSGMYLRGRPEVWAFGIRNIWPSLIPIERDDGELVLLTAHVGQDVMESVTAISRGSNQGWNVWEGDTRFNHANIFCPLADCDMVDGLGNPYALPVAAYFHEGGELRSITGGDIYNGPAIHGLHKDLEGLRGAYVFADWTRHLLALAPSCVEQVRAGVAEPDCPIYRLNLPDDTPGGPGERFPTMGRDARGDLYIGATHDPNPFSPASEGWIYRLTQADPSLIQGARASRGER